jgi:dipeptidyl-peptidase-4
MNHLISLLLLLITSFLAISQETLTLADIYKNGTYRLQSYGPVRWMKDNNGYSTLEENKKIGGFDIGRYEVKSGVRVVAGWGRKPDTCRPDNSSVYKKLRVVCG